MGLLFNGLGQSVYTKKGLFGASDLTIDCSHWNNGVFIVLTSLENGEKEIRKLMVR